MEVSQIKRYLGRRVYYKLGDSEHEYILDGCTIQQGQHGDYSYTATLRDVQQPKSVIVVDLEKVKVTREAI